MDPIILASGILNTAPSSLTMIPAAAMTAAPFNSDFLPMIKAFQVYFRSPSRPGIWSSRCLW